MGELLLNGEPISDSSKRDKLDYFIACVIVLIVVVVAIGGILVVENKTARPPISNDSTYAQVQANFTGKPYSTGEYDSGYDCKGYTNGFKDKNGVGHGWTVITCLKK